jgi:hypothetical protein
MTDREFGRFVTESADLAIEKMGGLIGELPAALPNLDKALCGLGEEEYEPETVWVAIGSSTPRQEHGPLAHLKTNTVCCYRSEADCLKSERTVNPTARSLQTTREECAEAIRSRSVSGHGFVALCEPVFKIVREWPV